MAMLRRGSKGKDVKEIQERLAKAGFPPGEIDGIYGKATERAVINFQQSECLLADGIVGPNTLEALFKKKIPSGINIKPEDITAKVTPSLVSRMFHASSRVKKNIEKYLPSVLKALKEEKLTDKNMVLMALATISAESGGFEPINEFKSKYNTSPGGHPFNLYDNRKDLGNTGKPDGELFKGRGFIQLTGRFNYAYYSKKLGMGDELVKNPEKANEPLTAARLLALFLKDKEFKIRNAILAKSYKEARRYVNGGSHGIVAFKDAYITGYRLLS